MRLVDNKRNVSRVALIVPTLALFIGAYATASAEAQNKSAARRPAAANAQQTSWNHNGSLVSLVTEGAKQKIIYQTPRVGLLDAGVKSGMVLFEGKKDKLAFTGTAYMFYRSCKPQTYPVSGDISENMTQITLKGRAPLLDFNCNHTGVRDDVLIFTAIQGSPSEPAKNTQVVASPRQTPDSAKPDQAATVAIGAAASAPAAAAPSPRPEAARTPDAPSAKSDDGKSADAGAANNSAPAVKSVVSVEASKETPAAVESKVESVKAPPDEATKETPTRVAAVSPSAAAVPSPVQSNPAPVSEPVKDAPPKASADNEKISGANKETASQQDSGAAPSGEPAKEIQTAALPSKDTAAKANETGRAKPTVAPKAAAAKEPANAKLAVAAEANSDKDKAAVASKIPPMPGNEKMMEIVLKNGRILRVGRDIELEVLSRLIAMLERQE